MIFATAGNVISPVSIFLRVAGEYLFKTTTDANDNKPDLNP
jgi:hypothetical protein